MREGDCSTQAGSLESSSAGCSAGMAALASDWMSTRLGVATAVAADEPGDGAAG